MIDFKGNPFYLSDDDITWVTETLANMTEEEKLQQLFFPLGISSEQDYLQHEVLDRKPGGLMFRMGTPEELVDAYTFLQNNSKIPMFLAANLESGGDGIVIGGTTFGKQMQVAAAGDPEQAYRLGKVACSEAQAVGCNYAFAPVVDIEMNYHNPITSSRTYGADPTMVRDCGLAYLKAAQECGSAVSVKHFPGDGVDEVDQHILTSVNSLSCEEWDATYGMVYQSLIDAGAMTVMAGHIAMPAYQKKFNPDLPRKLMPATLSPELLKGLLRGKLGFNGMIISDASPMVGFACAMDRAQSVPYCIEAGCDMILFNKDYEEDLEYMRQGLRNGILSEERLEEAVTRILAAKAAIRLHEKKENGTLVPEKPRTDIIGCEQHRNWAREIADKSVTLVKDTQHILPISAAKYPRVLYQILGDYPSEKRVAERLVEDMEREGFTMIPYVKEEVHFGEPMPFDTVEEFRSKYDLVLYLGNIESASNKTTNRINWYAPMGGGNNVPWFVEIVPTIFVSLQNPYHLLDVPMIKTYINAYSNHDVMIDAVVDKLTGHSPFRGSSPVDAFCGKEYLSY